MTREELIRTLWEEQHKQQVMMRRKHHGEEGPHGHPGHRPPPRQEHLLHMLKKNPGINQKDLAEKVHVRPQSLGEMLGKLEENGLIARKKDPADGRATLVELTPAGEAAEREHHEKLFAEIQKKFAVLTDDELEEYLRLTQKINEGMSEE